jgi:hypothetical protein
LGKIRYQHSFVNNTNKSDAEATKSSLAACKTTDLTEALEAIPEEVMDVLERTGRAKATYDVKRIFDVMAWQSYERHEDAEHFLAAYSGLSIVVTAIPSRRTYHCRFGWQKDFIRASAIMRVQACLLANPFQLCPVGMVNGKTLLMSPGTKEKEGDEKAVPTFFFVVKSGGRKVGLVGDNIVTVISWFARDSSAKVVELPPHFRKTKGR